MFIFYSCCLVKHNTAQHSTNTHSLAQDASINISYQYYVFYVQILTVTHTHQHTAHMFTMLAQFNSACRAYSWLSDQFMFRWIVGGVCVRKYKYANSPKCNILLFNQISHKAPKANFNENTHAHSRPRVHI